MTDSVVHVIETQNLTKKYNSFLVVDGLNLRIKRGEVFGFLGPNGAGKTTSIKMMVGLLKPTEGGVLIEGEEIESVEKGKIGVCPQDLVIWGGLTCEENIALIGDMYEVPRNVLKERIKQLLHDLILSDKTKTLASQLSGGMKRRLNLAMALIHDPEIVVLDEPSAGLDPQSRLVLWEYIHSLSKEKGKTIILTTHLMEEADRLSDRIAIMDHGKLLVLDTPESLKKKIGIVAVVILLTLSSVLLFASPLYACPGGGDISVAAMYKATSIGIDNLWDGRVPKRSDIEIISKLPTCGAKHAAQCIVGIPEGETPPEWKSDKPGEFSIVSDGENSMKLENFEITIIRKSNNKRKEKIPVNRQ